MRINRPPIAPVDAIYYVVNGVIYVETATHIHVYVHVPLVQRWGCTLHNLQLPGYYYFACNSPTIIMGI